MGVRDTKDELCDYWPHDNSEAKPLGMRNLNPFAFHYQTVALLPPLVPKRSQNQNQMQITVIWKRCSPAQSRNDGFILLPKKLRVKSVRRVKVATRCC